MNNRALLLGLGKKEGRTFSTQCPSPCHLRRGFTYHVAKAERAPSVVFKLLGEVGILANPEKAVNYKNRQKASGQERSLLQLTTGLKDARLCDSI
jgi:hypothetical protein